MKLQNLTDMPENVFWALIWKYIFITACVIIIIMWAGVIVKEKTKLDNGLVPVRVPTQYGTVWLTKEEAEEIKQNEHRAEFE